MFCKHCGAAISDNDSFCSNCQAPLRSNVSSAASVQAHVYNSPEEIKTKINATTLLVLSIVELICCNWIFGLIAVILYCTSLQNEIRNGNLEGALKAKKTITILLIVGLVISIATTLFTVFGIGVGILAEL